ncbi:retinal rod rhodopsin-sensitive cGMP 3',5'-cyclic phosphodiesterase subunit gamma isoform X1 [Manis javanica]|uniref:retinal rod rhodopsin-sensitive cGMP 3',5'-cyclic phosphodiesterase subunit gamma isoform X1 n=2 Tax=Manis javanica TaxID=9974 RepID=UPI003C6DA5F4
MPCQHPAEGGCAAHTRGPKTCLCWVPSALRPERCIRSKRADWDPWPGLPPAPRVRESKTKGHHSVSTSLAMNLEPPKAEVRSATRVTGGPVTPRKGPPKFKQRQTRQFKSKPPKKGIQGFGDDIPGMEGLGTDITVICPWEAFNHLELHELAQYGII